MQRLLNARRGFTLIELLVVIAIIALLIGMLMPALSGARDSARSVKCLASMRSLGVAMSLYSDDNGGLMPRSKHSVGFSGVLPWGPQMFEYLTGRPFEGASDLWQDGSWWAATNDFYRCGHDRRESPEEIAGVPYSRAVVSYGFNVYYELRREEIDPEKYPGSSFEPYRKRSSVGRPSGTVLLGEMSEASSADHIMSHFWRTRGVEPGFEVATERHGDGAGYLLLDGHAETRSFGEVYDAEKSRDAWYPAMVR